MNVMLDIETLSQHSAAAIVSIGAVIFDPNTGLLSDEFYCVIDIQDALKYGISDEETLAWWDKQSEEARAIFNPDEGAVGLVQALGDLALWLVEYQLKRGRQAKMWSNGSGFDLVIMRNAYTAANITCPWKFWNEFDVRTIVEIGRQKLNFNPKKDMPFVGETHNALADAKHQARYVSALWQMLEV